MKQCSGLFNEMSNDVFVFYSGVSVNVQDLAPSCAGALFGTFKKLFSKCIKTL